MISGNDSETESNSAVSIPAIVFVAIGLFAIIIGIALVAFFGGFNVMDEWDSKDWTETEVLAIGQDYTADEGTQIFFYNYSVDGVEYNSTFSCDFNVHGASEQTQGGSGNVNPWETQCLHDSEYYLNLESVAYNPDDPSEIDVYPGLTYRMIFEVYGPKLAPIVLVLVGLVIVLKARRIAVQVADKITEIKGKIADGNK
ncbi:MAG: hypothetical protein CXT67_06180 [Methanobacteriota archaeon]|jgi:hypothetical protein|nr:MAG: hypothetical protein CXT67_06180 [Euryarchaeota archaeon]HIG19720.1 hypothetical protein [Candidatus Poseidoniales archaeon]